MEIKVIDKYEAEIAVKVGISSKTNKPYRIPVVIIKDTPYGDIELNVDTRTTRGGILIDILTKGD